MMKLLRECRLIIRTGEHGTDHDVTVRYNGVRLVARKLAGGTDSGEMMLSTLYIGGPVQSMMLSHGGPGEWSVDYVELFGLMNDGEVIYKKVQPDFTIADGRAIQLWDQPMPLAEEAQQSFDV